MSTETDISIRVLHIFRLPSLHCQSAKVDREASNEFAVFVEVNVIVKICDHANVIRDDANAFADFWFLCGAP